MEESKPESQMTFQEALHETEAEEEDVRRA